MLEHVGGMRQDATLVNYFGIDELLEGVVQGLVIEQRRGS
jgi:hypothetical protein